MKNKIMFICHGNICRSVMAEFIFKHIAKENGDKRFTVESSAVSYEEIGNPIHFSAAKELKKHGIPYEDHRARRINDSENKDFDLFVCMDDSNVKNLKMIFDGKDEKIINLGKLIGIPEIEDPWYTGNFGKVYDEIYKGCYALYSLLTKTC